MTRNVCLSHLKDLSVLESIWESENERYLTGEMLSDTCCLFAILYWWENFKRSADDLWSHLYDHFKGDLRCLPPTENALRHTKYHQQDCSPIPEKYPTANRIWPTCYKLQWLTPTIQSELPRPIPRNSVESDQGCTSRIYFDNVGDNVTLTLYNVTLTSQKPCLHNNKCDYSKTKRL